MSSALSSASNEVLEEVSDQVASLSLGIENIYKNRDNFKGHIPRLPDNNNNLKIKDRNLATEQAYILNNNNLLNNELKLISNIFYLAQPMYTGNIALSNVYLGTQSGIFYRYSPYSSNNLYDHRLRTWYTDAIKQKKSNTNNICVWQNSYKDALTDNFCITCSKAFCDEKNNILGVIAADMYLSDIYKYITNSQIGETGYSFILDKEGQVIICPEYKLDIDFSKNLILKNNTEKIIINNKNYYISYAPMTTTGWTLCVAIESDEIIKPVIKTKDIINLSIQENQNFVNNNINIIVLKFLIIFLICFIIVFILAFLLSKKITRPIRDLILNIKKISNGDLSIKLPVYSEDEIGQLSIEFNNMTRDLQKYINNLAETTAEKERIHSELTVAKKIQFSMLPCIFPAFPDRKDFDIYAIMDPAKEVGGDFYDFFFVDQDNLALVIADVSGKGVSGALFMVIAKILIKNQAQSKKSPSEILEIVNNQLCENNEASMFVTVFIGIFNIKTGKFVFSNAGHNPPLIYRKSENKFLWLKSEKGFVLAGTPNIKYKNNEIYLFPEDILYMYTDGVTEAMNKKNDLFSNKKLENILNNLDTKNISLKEIIIYLRKEIEIFCEGEERTDDITMLAIKNFNINNKINEE